VERESINIRKVKSNSSISKDLRMASAAKAPEYVEAAMPQFV
jgi:hypothetical protein